MIYTKFYCKPGSGSIHMTLRGHSGAGPKGADLVCSAATMLAYTAAQSIQFLYEQGALKCRPKIRGRDGEATIIATPREDYFAQVLQTFWVVQCGCYVLSRNYPDRVSLEPVRYERMT